MQGKWQWFQVVIIKVADRTISHSPVEYAHVIYLAVCKQYLGYPVTAYPDACIPVNYIFLEKHTKLLYHKWNRYAVTSVFAALTHWFTFHRMLCLHCNSDGCIKMSIAMLFWEKWPVIHGSYFYIQWSKYLNPQYAGVLKSIFGMY